MYAVARQAGGLEGPRTLWVASEISSFWPVTATHVAVTGQQGVFGGGATAPENPTAQVLSY